MPVNKSRELYEGLWEVVTEDSFFFIGWFREAHANAFAEEVASGNIVSPSDRLADIACGDSAYPGAVSRTCGTTFVGLDLSSAALRESRRLLRGIYPERDSSVASLPQNDKQRRARNDRKAESLCAGLVQGEASQLPLASAAFDVVLSTHTLEHLSRDKETLEEFARILKMGGYLRLEVPNSKRQMLPLFRPLQGRLDRLGHLKEYRPGELTALLSQCKFSVQRFYYRDFLLCWLFFSLEEHFRPIVRLFRRGKARHSEVPGKGWSRRLLAAALSRLILWENRLLGKRSWGMNACCIARKIPSPLTGEG